MWATAWQYLKIAYAHAKAFYFFVKDGRLSYLSSLLITALVAVLSFQLGSEITDEETRGLKQKATELEESVRLFAEQVTEQNSELNYLRAESQLDKKVIRHLQNRFNDLETEAISKTETTETYQNILLGKLSTGFLIYALEISTGEAESKLSATLTKLDRRKQFKGRYYFEVVMQTEAGQNKSIFVPDEEGADIELVNHLEIEESVVLPTDEKLVEIKLQVFNSKKEVVASDSIQIEETEATNGVNGVNGSNEL